ncbi:MAG: hypothetical protein MUF12_00530 [Sediminibacterium sp.]|jgi:hypothetical protein|nr:hypothetical protein [Sediminibacterium sp.]
MEFNTKIENTRIVLESENELPRLLALMDDSSLNDLLEQRKKYRSETEAKQPLTLFQICEAAYEYFNEIRMLECFVEIKHKTITAYIFKNVISSKYSVLIFINGRKIENEYYHELVECFAYIKEMANSLANQES